MLGPLARNALEDVARLFAGAAGIKPKALFALHTDPLWEVWIARNLTAKTEEGERRPPRLISGKETATGRHLVYDLPPGLSPASLLDALDSFSAALKAECEGYWKDGFLHITSYERPMPDRVSWSPALADSAAGSLAFVVGESRAQTEVLDLAKGPFHHLLIGGLPGSGKSVFMRQALATLHHLHKPGDLRLHLVDLKGGVEFSAFAGSEMLESFATAPGEVHATLSALNTLVNKRMAILAHAGVENLPAYNRHNDPLPYHLVAIDELAELPDTAAPLLTRLLRLARFAGVHVVAATQRPDRETVPGQMKALLGATVAFRVRNQVNSQILLDNDRAAHLPPLPGRAIYQGTAEREVQVPFISLEEAKTLAGNGKPKETRKW